MKNLKKVFYMIMCIALAVLFVSCKEKVPVTKIDFKENVIEMLVGDYYDPDILFTPTYATDKTVVYKTNKPTVFWIVDGKVYGRANGVGLLTATTADGKISASVEVRVYQKPLQLGVPTGLHYDGELLKFTAVTNAFNYTMKLNNTEYVLGNNNYFSGIAENEIITAQVKATGNERASISSDYSDEYKFYQLSSPKNLTLINNILSWDAVAGVNKYIVSLQRNGETLLPPLEPISTNTLNIGAYFTSAGEYNITVKASASDFDTSTVQGFTTNTNLIDSKTSQKLVIKPTKPSNLKIVNNILLFDKVNTNGNYFVEISNGSDFTREYNCGNNNYFDIPGEVLAGSYTAKVKVAGQNNTTDSDYSEKFYFTKLATPALSISDGKIIISPVAGANGYILRVNLDKIDISNTLEYTLNEAFEDGEYILGVQAYSNAQNVLASNFTTEENIIVAKKLSKATNLDMVNNVLSFDSLVSDTFEPSYKIYIDNVLFGTTSEKQMLISSDNLELPKQYIITIKAVSSHENILYSDMSPKLIITKLVNSSNIEIQNEILYFTKVTNAFGYKLEFVNKASGERTQVLINKNEDSCNLKNYVEQIGDGEFDIELVALGDGRLVIDSFAAVLQDVSVLAAPILSVSGNEIVWSNILNATGYEISANNDIIIKNNNSLELDHTFAAGVYSIKAKAIGDGGLVLSSAFSSEEDTLVVEKLAKVTGFSFNKNTLTLSWTANINAQSYELTLADGSVIVLNENYYIFAANTFKDAGDYTYRVRAMGGKIEGNKTYLSGELSSPYSVTKLQNRLSISMLQNKLVWDSVADCSYILEIKNGDAISLSDNYISLYDLQTYVPTLYFENAAEYIVRIKLVGDFENTIDSVFTEYIAIYKLNAVANVHLSNSMLVWDVNSLASGYSVIIDNVVHRLNLTNLNAEGGKLYSDIIKALDIGVHNVSVIALGDDEYTFASSPSATVSFSSLGQPKVSFDSSIFEWDTIENADCYIIELTGEDSNGQQVNIKETITENYYSILAIDIVGNIRFSVSADNYADHYYVQGKPSLFVRVNRLSSPLIYIENGVLKWEAVSGANQYILNIPSIAGFEPLYFSSAGYYDFAGIPAGTYLVNMYVRNGQYCFGDANYNDIIGNSVVSSLNARKLAAPNDLSVDRGLYQFTSVEGASIYYFKIGDRTLYLPVADPNLIKLYSNIIAESAIAGVVENAYITASAEDCINSDPSNIIKIKMMNTVKNAKIEQEAISWDIVEHASGYVVFLYYYDGTELLYSQNFFLSGGNTNTMQFPEFSHLIWGSGKYIIAVRAYGGQYLDASDNIVYYTMSKQNSNTVQATRLAAPSNLRSLDGVITWDANEDATNYQLLINGVLFETGGNINSFVLPDTYTEGVYNIQVKAIGNDKNVLSSIYCDSRDFIRLRAAESFSSIPERYLYNGDLSFNANALFTKVVITFTNVDNSAFKYVKTYNYSSFASFDSKVYLSSFIEIYGSDISTWDFNAVFNEMAMRFIKYESPIDIAVGKYIITIKLIGNSFSDETVLAEDKIATLSSKTITIGEFVKLPTPILSVDDGVVSWDIGEVSGNMIYSGPLSYIVYMTLSDGRVISKTTTQNSIDFKLDTWEYGANSLSLSSGNFSVKVILRGDNTKFLSSEVSSSQTVRILSAPAFLEAKGILKWSKINFAGVYELEIENENLPGGVLKITLNSEITSFDLSQKIPNTSLEFPAGLYTFKITAKGNGKDILDSKSYNTTAKTKLDIDDANFTLANGVLTWNRVGNTNCYEILINGQTISITLYDEFGKPSSDKISITAGGVVTYELPDNIVAGSTQNVRLKVISDDEGYLHSHYSNQVSGVKFNTLYAAYVQDGQLRWSIPADIAEYISGYYVRVSFTHEQVLKSKVFTVSTNSFVLPDTVEIDGILYQLKGGEYLVEVKIKGNAYYFNSNFNNFISAVRLDDVKNIRTNYGLLMWDSVSNATKYILTVGNNTPIELDGDTNSFDCSNAGNFFLDAGLFTVNIKACADVMLNSRISNTYTFEKLSLPSNIEVGEIYITWDNTTALTSGTVINYYIEIKSLDTGATFYENIYENKYRLGESYVNGHYYVRVKAITSTNTVINSDWSEAQAVTKPATVTNLIFNNDKKRWEWDSVTGITKYIITYSYKALGEQQTATYSHSLTDNFFKPSELGMYSAFNVQAFVSGSVASDAAQWQGDGGITEYTFDLYKSGNGTQSTPYKISNIHQLKNIDYYSAVNVYFDLNNDININGTESSVIGLRKIFEGYFDGKNYTISNVNINGVANYKGLFARAENASIKNLKLDKVKISGDISNPTSEIYAGLLIGHGYKLIIDNITIENIDSTTYNNLELSITNMSKNLNIGGLAGYISASAVTNIFIKINSKLVFSSQSSAEIYMGGLIGNVAFEKNNLTNISNARVQLTDSTETSNMFKLGGLVSYNTGNISSSRAILNMTYTANNVGGLVSYNVGNITNCYSMGNIKGYSFVNQSAQRDGVAGGLVGENAIKYYVSPINVTQEGSIKNCYSTVSVSMTTDIPVGYSDTAGYAGGIVGRNSNGFVDNCWTASWETNGIITASGNQSFSASIIGYNNVAENVTNCYYTQSNIAANGTYNPSGLIQKTVAEMQQTAFVTLLNANAGETVWTTTTNGLPILIWQL